MRRLIDRANDGIRNSRIITPASVNVMTFPHLVAVYRDVKLTVGGDKEAADLAYIKVSAGQICMFTATPETEQPDFQGRSKVTNIFTNDKFFFPVGALVEDTYVLHMLSPLPDYVGRWWVVEGNAQGQERFPFQVTAVQMVYAKLSPVPLNLS